MRWAFVLWWEFAETFSIELANIITWFYLPITFYVRMIYKIVISTSLTIQILRSQNKWIFDYWLVTFILLDLWLNGFYKDVINCNYRVSFTVVNDSVMQWKLILRNDILDAFVYWSTLTLFMVMLDFIISVNFQFSMNE